MNTKIKALNVRYAFIHCIYWSLLGSSFSFCSAFLLSKGVANGQIGVIFAVGNVLAVVIQPLLASFLDRTSKVSIKLTIALLSSVGAALVLLRLFFFDTALILGISYTVELGLIFSLHPLINSLGMQLINEGRNLNYGIARGIGSLAFAVTMVILGALTQAYGSDIVTKSSLLLYGFLLVAVLTFVNATKKQCKSEETAVAQSLPEFIHTHHRFLCFVVGIALVFIEHSYISNYLIQIILSVGGSNKDLGFANAFAALLELPAMMGFLWLRKHFRCSLLLKLSFVSLAVKAVMLFFSGNVALVFVSQGFQLIGYALYIPASIYYINQVMEKENLVKGQSIATCAVTIGGIIASLSGGWLLDSFGVPVMLLVGAITSILGMLIALYAIKKTA